ncbi:hypothetical protein AAC387_Pa12g1230 [Persea americana]
MKKIQTPKEGSYKKVPKEIPMISSGAEYFNVCMAKIDGEKSQESSPRRYQQEEPLQYRLERQDNQIGRLLGMLIELKEKLETAIEKKNVEKESVGSDEGLAKEVVPEDGTPSYPTV